MNEVIKALTAVSDAQEAAMAVQESTTNTTAALQAGLDAQKKVNEATMSCLKIAFQQIEELQKRMDQPA